MVYGLEESGCPAITRGLTNASRPSNVIVHASPTFADRVRIFRHEWTDGRTNTEYGQIRRAGPSARSIQPLLATTTQASVARHRRSRCSRAVAISDGNSPCSTTTAFSLQRTIPERFRLRSHDRRNDERRTGASGVRQSPVEHHHLPPGERRHHAGRHDGSS